jgi:hypothetical protein
MKCIGSAENLRTCSLHGEHATAVTRKTRCAC